MDATDNPGNFEHDPVVNKDSSRYTNHGQCWDLRWDSRPSDMRCGFLTPSGITWGKTVKAENTLLGAMKCNKGGSQKQN